jgi:tetratricopeptide (TPR) repeat protein
VDNVRVLKHLEAIEGYLTLGMTEDALAEADAVLAEAPQVEAALRAKAFVLLTLKRYAEAQQWFERLVAVNHRHVEGWIHLAYCRRRTTSLEAAVAALQHALDLDGGHALANFNMACYRALQGRHNEALKLLRKAIEKDASYRAMARMEKDFDSVRGLAKFEEMVGEE